MQATKNETIYKVEKDKLIVAAEPTASYDGIYTYVDYCTWKIKERVELIKGRIFKMAAAPGMYHQKVSTVISGEFYFFLKTKECKAFTAPFDVRFVDSSKADDSIITVLQPDICVICDLDKLDHRGCLGSPDLVVEILSPSSSRRDLNDKYEIYETYGVHEYWVVHPSGQTRFIP